MENNEKKISVLKDALQARHAEFFDYQINIDNFERAIKKIENDESLSAEMEVFKNHLEETLRQSKHEQTKCSIIRDVIKEQLFELTQDPCFM